MRTSSRVSGQPRKGPVPKAAHAAATRSNNSSRLPTARNSALRQSCSSPGRSLWRNSFSPVFRQRAAGSPEPRLGWRRTIKNFSHGHLDQPTPLNKRASQHFTLNFALRPAHSLSTLRGPPRSGAARKTRYRESARESQLKAAPPVALFPRTGLERVVATLPHPLAGDSLTSHIAAIVSHFRRVAGVAGARHGFGCSLQCTVSPP